MNKVQFNNFIEGKLYKINQDIYVYNIENQLFIAEKNKIILFLDKMETINFNIEIKFLFEEGIFFSKFHKSLLDKNYNLFTLLTTDEEE